MVDDLISNTGGNQRMDKLQQYRQVIRQVLTEQAHPYSHSNDVDTEIICDTEHDSLSTCLCGLGRAEADI
jgi:hypothetical protein